jgi:SnoaL-like domain
MTRIAPFVALSLTLALGAGVLTSAVAEAQGGAGQGDAAKASRLVMTLTPLDYVEIRQLAARYAHAVDQGADDGYAYADLFAPGANFGKTTGRDDLAKLAKETSKGPQTAWHFIVNHVIEPTEDGAKGKEYLVHLQYGDADKPNVVWGGGHYEDTYVKTADGWRFKTRQFVPSDGTPESLKPQPAAAR